jgi:hypothetical protein
MADGDFKFGRAATLRNHSYLTLRMPLKHASSAIRHRRVGTIRSQLIFPKVRLKITFNATTPSGFPNRRLWVAIVNLNGSDVLQSALRSSQLQRFANFSCPVRTHTYAFVLSNLQSSQLREMSSVAGHSAPRVHQ